jgi:hypothetical protein
LRERSVLENTDGFYTEWLCFCPDAGSNGLTHLVERLKREELAGHVTLVKGERSKVAELAARLL